MKLDLEISYNPAARSAHKLSTASSGSAVFIAVGV